MADEKKTETTTEVAGLNASNQVTAITEIPAENKRDTSGDQTVLVRALRVFHKGEHMTGEMSAPGDEFEVPRSRASQLRSHGLIEYVADGDETAIHGEVDAKRIGEKVKQRDAAAEIPANSKGTPLRNPEVKLADVDSKSAK